MMSDDQVRASSLPKKDMREARADKLESMDHDGYMAICIERVTRDIVMMLIRIEV